MLRRRQFGAVATAGLFAAGAAGANEAFPDRPLRMLVGYPPGGGVDIFARLIAEQMRPALGQPIIVENRPGAAAMIAAQAVARAAPDGYTMLMAAAGEIAVSPALYKERMAYDPARELAPLILAGTIPCLVVVPTALPVRTPAELIAYCRANRGTLTFSSSGIGNPQQLAGELMNFMAGTNVVHVPYRGSAPAVTDVAGGRVTMSFSSLGAALPLIQAGQLRAVAVTSRDRMPQLPEVAPLAEAPGMAGYELINWFAMFGTAAAPAANLARIAQVAAQAIADPVLAAKLVEQGAIPRRMTPAEMRVFVADETRKFAEIIQRANISVDG